MSVNAEQWAFLQDVAKLIQWAKEQGYMLTGGELKRTLAQQAIYVKKGFSDTMESLHLMALAQDLNVFIKRGSRWRLTYDYEDVKPLGDYWKSLNPKNHWGGDFKLRSGGTDTPHFERRLK